MSADKVKRSRVGKFILVPGILLLLACAGSSPQVTTHELLNATLWVQTSAEYQAVCLQAYQQARQMLEQALIDPSWTAALEQNGDYATLSPAIILDVDETVLDNSPNEARLIRSDSLFTYETWDVWVKEARARAVPGALDFCREASTRGVTVFYVTNRQDHLKEATRHNLRELGFPLDDVRETVITQGGNSDKGPRRAAIAREYRILLLIGDDARDFSSVFVNKSLWQRNRLPVEYSDYWGKKWIILPNPLYGDWEKALFGKEGYDLNQSRRLEKKNEALQFE